MHALKVIATEMKEDIKVIHSDSTLTISPPNSSSSTDHLSTSSGLTSSITCPHSNKLKGGLSAMALSGGLGVSKDRKRQLELSATKKNKRKESHETNGFIPLCFIISTEVSSADFFGGSTKFKHTLTAAQVSMSKKGKVLQLSNDLGLCYVEPIGLAAIEGQFIDGIIKTALRKVKEKLGLDGMSSSYPFMADENGRYSYFLHELTADKLIGATPLTDNLDVRYSRFEDNGGSYIDNSTLAKLHKPRMSDERFIYVFGKGTEGDDEVNPTKRFQKIHTFKPDELCDLTGDVYNVPSVSTLTTRQAEVKLEAVEKEKRGESDEGSVGDDTSHAGLLS